MILRRLGVLAATLTAVLAIGLIGAPAEAVFPKAGPFLIKAGGRCAGGPHPLDGFATVQVTACSGGRAQWWRWDPATRVLRNAGSGQCARTADVANRGTILLLGGCPAEPWVHTGQISSGGFVPWCWSVADSGLVRVQLCADGQPRQVFEVQRLP
ncbi:hypothetical protein [Amycolatopsis sp. NPDC059657]|uniref:hypothetical protein n=1 Tax=Amycolatopsis sp. NPDC059657 TaxID=3346899 RepID=UPI00367227E8